ncbi:MAG: sigma-70 family RNA polymerase sigma factor [Verrucomicrobiota bacterium]|nr:sigma-70 family RNA polymerase sigma factor [Verrucomicrobiota bacterium]
MIFNSDGQDLSLIKQITTKNKDAFRELYDRYGRIIYSFIHRIVGDEKEASDIFADAMSEIWEKAYTFNPTHSKPLTWIIGIAHTQALKHVRNRKTPPRIPGSIPPPPMTTKIITPVEESLIYVNRIMVKSAFDNLSADQKTAIELAYFGGFKQSSIASQMGQTVDHVKNHIHQGMKRLRELIQPEPRK